jgi:hypothetical protein
MLQAYTSQRFCAAGPGPLLAFASTGTTTTSAMTRSMAARWALGALQVGLCFGCASRDPWPGAPADAGSADAEPVPRIVLGTGREVFEPLASEGTIEAVKGLQGGFHVWASLLAYGFDSDVVRMKMATRWGSRDESLIEMAGVVGLQPDTDAAGEQVLRMAGWTALVSDPRCANGQPLDIVVTITSDSQSASDTRRWILDVPEVDRATDCAP